MRNLFKGSSTINLEKVSLGKTTVSIPIAEFFIGSNKHILITGGVDGDEYAGIEAAYALIDQFIKNKLKFSITVVPILNIPGFEKAVSYNPLDNRFPKHLFPGKPNGTPTERLVNWLATRCIHEKTIAWIDLHSGALTESLTPFIGTYETHDDQLNTVIRHVLATVSADIKVFAADLPPQINQVAKQNIAYFILESGEKGERNKEAINQHISWANEIMQTLATETKQKVKNKQFVYQHIQESTAPQDGLWYPFKQVGQTVGRNDILGEIHSLSGELKQVIKSKEPGILLWEKSSLICSKGDILIGVAH